MTTHLLISSCQKTTPLKHQANSILLVNQTNKDLVTNNDSFQSQFENQKTNNIQDDKKMLVKETTDVLVTNNNVLKKEFHQSIANEVSGDWWSQKQQ